MKTQITEAQYNKGLHQNSVDILPEISPYLQMILLKLTDIELAITELANRTELDIKPIIGNTYEGPNKR
jgi:hypothetical protein